MRSQAAHTARAAFSASCPLYAEKGYMLRLGKEIRIGNILRLGKEQYALCA